MELKLNDLHQLCNTIASKQQGKQNVGKTMFASVRSALKSLIQAKFTVHG